MDLKTDFATFCKDLKDLHDQAWRIADDFANKSWYLKDEDEEFREVEETLTHYIERLVVRISFGLEILGLVQTRVQFLKDFEGHRKSLTALTPMPYTGDLMSPTLIYLDQYISAFVSLAGQPTTSEPQIAEIDRLKNVLRATGVLIYQRKLKPSKENDVRDMMAEHLSSYFPDTRKDPPIAKIFKVFHPDIGVKSLHTAIEYKFVDSPEEMKKAIGGIYEDMHGYAGSEDWTTFISVIYMTDNFTSEARVREEFKESKTPDNWSLILVSGNGRRVTKKAKIVKAAGTAGLA